MYSLNGAWWSRSECTPRYRQNWLNRYFPSYFRILKQNALNHWYCVHWNMKSSINHLLPHLETQLPVSIEEFTQRSCVQTPNEIFSLRVTFTAEHQCWSIALMSHGNFTFSDPWTQCTKRKEQKYSKRQATSDPSSAWRRSDECTLTSNYLWEKKAAVEPA